MKGSDPSRRRFVAALGAAAAGALIPKGARPEGFATRPIPSTGETIPAIGLGTSGPFNAGSSGDSKDRLRTVLSEFHRLGGRVVDTSPMYGNAEEAVGTLAAEKGIGGSLYLATKVWTTGREAGVRQMKDSLRLLRRERLDLIQVHNLIDAKTHLATLAAWKREGRVRHLGITHWRIPAFADLERWMKAARPDFVQLPYSVAEREAEARLLPLAADLGIAVLVNRPFEDGALFRRVRGMKVPEWAPEAGCASWAQLFLKFLLGHPAVTCAIPATGNPAHLADNMGAGRGPALSEEHRKRLAAIVRG